MIPRDFDAIHDNHDFQRAAARTEQETMSDPKDNTGAALAIAMAGIASIRAQFDPNAHPRCEEDSPRLGAVCDALLNRLGEMMKPTCPQCGAPSPYKTVRLCSTCLDREREALHT